MMKGESPVGRVQQAVAEIREYLNRHLGEGAGPLSGVLLRRVTDRDLLLHGFEHGLKEWSVRPTWCGGARSMSGPISRKTEVRRPRKTLHP